MDYPQIELLIALAKASCIIAVGVFALLSAKRSRKDLLSTRLSAANLALAFMLVPSLWLGTKWTIQRTVITREAVLEPLDARRSERSVKFRGIYIDAWGVEIVNRYYDEAERKSLAAPATGWRITARWSSHCCSQIDKKSMRAHDFTFEFHVPENVRLNDVLLNGKICLLEGGSRRPVASCLADLSVEGTPWNPPPTTTVDFYWTPTTAGLRPSLFYYSRETLPVAWEIDHISISRGAGVISVRLPAAGEGHFLTRLDQSSLTFGLTGDEPSLMSCDRGPRGYLSDCHFDAAKAGIQASDRRGVLKGRTVDGILVIGIGGIPSR